MPGRFIGPNPYWSGPLPVLLSGLSLLLWLGMLALLVWAASRWLLPRASTPRAEPLADTREVSAVELVRRRYALGEIDAVTFEQMMERLMASETRETYDAHLQRLLDMKTTKDTGYRAGRM